MSRRLLILAVALLACVYAATGVFVVQPNEQVVLRRFGRALGVPLEPGLHWDLPFGLASIDRVKSQETKRVSLGSAAPMQDVGNRSDEFDFGAEGRFLTGDQNLVNLSVALQYSVSDPHRYLFAAKEVDRLLAAATESELTRLCAIHPVDDILLNAQSLLAGKLVQSLQSSADRFDVGVRVLNVNLTASPPMEVKASFDDVVKARSDKETRINDANTYASRIAREAQATAQAAVNQGQLYAARRAAEANAQAARFGQLLAAYRASRTPAGVLRRLLLETLEEVLPRMEKVVVNSDSDDPIDLNLLRTKQR